MKRPRAILFDLDGTLIDTAPDFIRCLNAVRARYKLPHLPEPEIRESVSDGARAMIHVGFGLTPEDEDYFDRHSEFLDLYESEIAVETKLFPGMETLLTWLEENRIAWGIVTNKPRRFSVPLLHALDLHDRSDVLVCPDDVDQRKPHPESLLLASELLHIPAAECIYVGDHARDIEAGKRAGMTTVAARYGYIRHPGEIPGWQADFIIDSAGELLAMLQNRYTGKEA
ncbi:HAD family hydrolase [Marinobacter halodurans]|uniref:HAD family hydrolase n=1 Tax=Marinobacter halodurans TaxID=2528979 RepID=A0ABY1ZLS9_9GAMM|nr:HAD-IA family hydrolase [Marinobacter halodurans]TBW56635.1 HAD family hydrolase [Marinobacter halodurans]